MRFRPRPKLNDFDRRFIEAWAKSSSIHEVMLIMNMASIGSTIACSTRLRRIYKIELKALPKN